MLARMGDWAIAVELDDDDDPVNPASGVDWRGATTTVSSLSRELVELTIKGGCPYKLNYLRGICPLGDVKESLLQSRYNCIIVQDVVNLGPTDHSHLGRVY